MFRTILISVITLMHFYVFWRFRSIPLLNRHVSGTVYAGTGLFLWATFISGHIIGHGETGIPAQSLEFAGMTWMAVLFLCMVCLIMTELITGFGFLLKRQAPTIRGSAMIMGMCLSVIALVQGIREPVVVYHEVNLSGLPHDLDGTVIVAISDMHLGSLIGKKWLERRVAQIQQEDPDLVLLLGDIFEGHGANHNDLIPTLQGISAPLGLFAVPGNHEFHGTDNGVLFLIEEAGFRLLFNRWVEVCPGLIISGVEDLTYHNRRGLNNDPISTALTGRPEGATILLSHTPWQVEQAAEKGVGLILSGHTHGGQIWPFGYLVKHYYPFFIGRYELMGMTAIVSRGTGTWGPRMRLWHRGEILNITLNAKDSWTIKEQEREASEGG
ncbi:MAG TPA: metallophosphoesterase [Deltaproteobacteria bacterium]|nr:metallophosphoesterase [Deltaproteobacteria bacterium]